MGNIISVVINSECLGQFWALGKYEHVPGAAITLSIFSNVIIKYSELITNIMSSLIWRSVAVSDACAEAEVQIEISADKQH